MVQSTRGSPGLAHERAWAVVLAGGSGARLESLTTGDDGTCVPKQFCSLQGGRSLLADALARATCVAPRDRILCIVADEHRRFWLPELVELVPGNIIVQPRNRGTAAGILLPLLSILERDPDAGVVFLPSDHHVENEDVLAAAMQTALRTAPPGSARVTLLGITPDAPTCDYGWIVPAGRAARLQRVDHFVEKPAFPLARRLMDLGGLWNSFLMVGRGQAFLELCARRQPGLVSALAPVATLPAGRGRSALKAVYESLPATDFSRDVLQGSEEHLNVLEVARCGWTDLGTPGRVSECLRSTAQPPIATAVGRRTVLDLRRALAALEEDLHARAR